MANQKNTQRQGEASRRLCEHEQQAEAKKLRARERQQKYRLRKRQRCQDMVDFAEHTTSELNSDLQRSSTRLALQIAPIIHQLTSLNGVEHQRLTIQKVFKHPILRNVLPDVVVHARVYETALEICNSMRQGWEGVKGAHSIDDLRTRNVVTSMVVSDATRNIGAIGNLLGLRHRVLGPSLSRRQRIEDGTVAEWATGSKAKRRDALPEKIQFLVSEWWTSQTRVSPTGKDVIRHRENASSPWIKHAAHFLLEPQLYFYTRFMEANPTVKIGYISFHKLKPWFVKRIKDFDSCCCRYCTEIRELKDGLNKLRGSTVHANCRCVCEQVCRPANILQEGAGGDSCLASQVVQKGVTELWQSVVCPLKQNAIWHDLQCIKGQCRSCGLKLLKLCPHELDPQNSNLVSWRCFEEVDAGSTRAGDPKQVIRLVHKETNPITLIAYLKPKLQQFLLHNFVARWQHSQYKECLARQTPETLVSVIDFAENYSFQEQNEIQSQHWFNFQITILVHITWKPNPDYDPDNVKSRRHVATYHYYISDDKKHDSLFVQHCFSLHWNWLKSVNEPLPTEHIVFSDGCSGQFKCARAWYHVARYQEKTKSAELPIGCVMGWHFFGTGHGKGTWDGAGAHLKNFLRSEQLKTNSQRLHNAADVVDFCNRHMSMPHAAYRRAKVEVRRHFHLVKVGDVNRTIGWDCKTVDGSRSKHSIQSVSAVNKTFLRVRELSCFCDYCVDGGDGPCANEAFVANYNLVTLQPCNSTARTDEVDGFEDDHLISNDGEMLARSLEEGDHFAVLAEQDSETEFWILICTERLHMVEEENKTDSYGQTVTRGDQIVKGKYYKQQGRSEFSYVFCPEGEAFIYSHLIRAIKFPMTQAVHRQRGNMMVFKLDIETHAQLYSMSNEALEELQD